MKNFPVKVDGKEWWISRSVAVAVNVYTIIDNKVCILANKRGPGLPNHVGEWNCISGYIDFDESLIEACEREVWEETGVKINAENCKVIELYKVEDDPKRENQVILFRYWAWYSGPTDVLTNENSEPNEVDEIKWIPLDEVDNYTWTSENHKNLIKKIFREAVMPSKYIY